MKNWCLECSDAPLMGILLCDEQMKIISYGGCANQLSQEVLDEIRYQLANQEEKDDWQGYKQFRFSRHQGIIHGLIIPLQVLLKKESALQLIVISICSELNPNIVQKYAESYLLGDLQEIIEGSFDGILVTDGDGNVQLVNQSYVRNTGIQKEELLGHNISELINPVWMKQSVAVLVRDRRETVSLEHTTKHNKNIIVTGTPVFDTQGNIKKIVVNTRDITEIYALRSQLDSTKKMEQYYMESLAYQKNPGEWDEIVAADEKTQKVFSMGKRLGNFNTNVLVTGESGVGKDELARFIHRNGIRRDKNYIAVNCGAIPENLFESELFGYESGAFTGASRTGKKGFFEMADGGTLFLDEIGEMPMNLQVKLLRVLETREIVRLGGTKNIPVDVRIIAATNQDLKELVKKGAFREDLFYRLSVVNLAMPPLRERKKDIPFLSLKFVQMNNQQYNENKKLTYPVIEKLQEYAWPGNVRELKNVIENMFIFSRGEYFQLQDIPWVRQDVGSQEENLSLNEAVERLERQLLAQAKEQFHTTRAIAAHLKLDQSTVVRKMKKYGL